jgi:3-oxoacyl-[acyl-carrier protein] reductase
MQANRYGRVVNISTIAVPLNEAGTSIYGASKSAGEQFARVLAREVISYGITVNTLALSFVKDGNMAKYINEKAVKEALSKTIFNSALDLKDVTIAIDFLISPQSRAVTGHTLYVGGI